MDGKDSDKTKENKDSNSTECTVCLQSFVQPVQLPCKHIFCFLCVKGLTQQNNKCALCRKEIPQNYMRNPCLITVQELTEECNESYKWFYQGASGWWQYDDRTSAEIETAYENEEQQCEVLIAGTLYTIDFQEDVQFQKFNPSCRRHIKRDLVTISKKGIAGIRQNCHSKPLKSSCSNNATNSCNTTVSENRNKNEVVIIVPHNGLPNICVTLDNGILSAPSKPRTSCSKADDACNPSTSKTLANSIIVPHIHGAGVCPNPHTEVLPESINCKASCSNDNSDNVTPSNKLIPNDDVMVVAPPSNKRKRTKSSDILQITEHILEKGENKYNAFGTYVAAKLCDMDSEQRLYAEKIINDTLFQGLLGKLSADTNFISPNS